MFIAQVKYASTFASSGCSYGDLKEHSNTQTEVMWIFASVALCLGSTVVEGPLMQSWAI